MSLPRSPSVSSLRSPAGSAAPGIRQPIFYSALAGAALSGIVWWQSDWLKWVARFEYAPIVYLFALIALILISLFLLRMISGMRSEEYSLIVPRVEQASGSLKATAISCLIMAIFARIMLDPKYYRPRIVHYRTVQEASRPHDYLYREWSEEMDKLVLRTPIFTIANFRGTGYEAGDLNANRLGRGSFGSVHRIQHIASGEWVAAKLFPLMMTSPATKKIAVREVRLMRELNGHPNIVKLREAFISDFAMVFIMDLYDAGSLDGDLTRHGPFNEAQLAAACKQIVQGLVAMDKRRIVHRDIKSANIFARSDGRLVIGDFGVATRLSFLRYTRKSRMGTPVFMAPEVAYAQPYSCKADVWSLGMTALHLANGQYPNIGMEYRELMEMLGQQGWVEGMAPMPSWASADMRDFIKQCLVFNQYKRPSASALLNHPFIRKAKGPELLQERFSQPEIVR